MEAGLDQTAGPDHAAGPDLVPDPHLEGLNPIPNPNLELDPDHTRGRDESNSS